MGTEDRENLINMKEIIQKAEIRRFGKVKEKVNLQHLSPNRNTKKIKYAEDVSQNHPHNNSHDNYFNLQY